MSLLIRSTTPETVATSLPSASTLVPCPARKLLAFAVTNSPGVINTLSECAAEGWGPEPDAVVEVQMKRWVVDIGGRQDAVLMLTSANLPHGVQRRRTQEDQLQMRSLFSEGDTISAEVHSFFQDGVMSIHARNLRYGKLGNGQLVVVAPSLMRRLKQHFVSLPELGVELILGMNGRIWVTKKDGGASGGGASQDAVALQEQQEMRASRVIGASDRSKNCTRAQRASRPRRRLHCDFSWDYPRRHRGSVEEWARVHINT